MVVLCAVCSDCGYLDFTYQDTESPCVMTTWNAKFRNSLEALRKDEEWVIWKTRDDRWAQDLKKEVFHQLLSLDKDTRESSWGHKIKRW